MRPSLTSQIRESFLKIQKTQSMKENMNKLHLKLENICLLKNPICLFVKENHLGNHMDETYKTKKDTKN